MCGITGLAFSVNTETPINNQNEFIDDIKYLFSDLLISIENRGKSATGVAVLNKEDKIYYVKKDIPATDFMKTRLYKAILDKISEDTISIIGHTRTPTNGPATNNDNNHPHVAGKTIGIHNGTIVNYVDLEKKWHLGSIGLCDSEVIFRLYDWAREQAKQTHDKSIRFLNEQLGGSYSCAFFTKHEPNNLTLFRGWGELETNLLEEGRTKSKVFIFNSEQRNMTKVLSSYPTFAKLPNPYIVKKDSYLSVNPITWISRDNSF